MTVEAKVYKLLSSDKEFNELLDRIRGKSFPGGYKQGIFTYAIPENPVSVIKPELAPFVRINPNYEIPVFYADDNNLAEEYRVTINFWCRTGAQSEEVAHKMDEILERNGFERYTANEKPRYKDNDIGLLTNIRKYRFFDWKKESE
jgi:hypothetical protein|nr:MAG TPA: tail component [Caudoviricetes sp.]